MSMNLYIHGLRKAFAFNKNGKKIEFEDRKNFSLWQTPTNVTYEILALSTPEAKVEAYVSWAKTRSVPYEEEIYDYSGELDDNYNYPVIGKKMVDPIVEHEESLREFVESSYEEGFDIEFYTL